jgi:hypothetical protein
MAPETEPPDIGGGDGSRGRVAAGAGVAVGGAADVSVAATLVANRSIEGWVPQARRATVRATTTMFLGPMRILPPGLAQAVT